MSEYYKRIEKIVFRHINTILRRSVLFQRLLLPVGDCYEQCGLVGAWAKHGVCRRCEEQIENKERVVRRIEEVKGKYTRSRVFLTMKTKDLRRFMLRFI